MRLLLLSALLWCGLATFVAAWGKEDQEIFRLKDELETAEGPQITFYEFLGVKSNANQEDIQKAFKKKSRTLHPDKVKQQLTASRSLPKSSKSKTNKKKPGVHVARGPSDAEVRSALKKASDRYARLTLVAQVLRGSGRERYDHFLKNGFPRWKGTGYYYARFRPGLASVLFGLFVVCGGGAHYGALYLGWKRQKEFVGRYVRHARRAAWGDDLGIQGISGIDGAGTAAPIEERESDIAMQGLNRRQRRMQEKEGRKTKNVKDTNGAAAPELPPASAGPQGDKKKVIAENGKVLIVDAAGSVYLEEENDDGETEVFLLDVDEIPKPSIKQTALFRMPIWCYEQTIGRVLKSRSSMEQNTTEGGSDSEAEEDDTSLRGKGSANSRRKGRKNGKAR